MEPRYCKPFLKRSRAAPGSNTSPNSRVYCDSGMSRRKKVKFADSLSVQELRCEKSARSVKTETTRSPSSDRAKTSEYKYFKKLHEEAGHKCCSYGAPVQEINLKTSKERDGVANFYNSGTCKSDMSKSILPLQNVTPIAERSSFTPAMVTENCALNSLVTCKYDVNKSSLPIHSVMPISQRSIFTPAEVSWNYGRKYKHSGIFTEKRRKLLQLALQALSLEIDELRLNRSDSIFKFLHRLGTGRKSSDHEKLTKSVQKVSNDWCRSLAASKFDGPLEEVLELTGRNLFPTISTKHSRTDLLAHKCKRTDDCISFPLEYSEIEVSPTWHAIEAGFQCNKQSNWVLDEAGSSDLHAENRSTSAIEWSTEFGYMLPKFVYPIPRAFSAYHPFTEKSLVPYTKRTSTKLCDLHGQELHLELVKEQCTTRLLGWNEDIEEPGLSFGSESEMDHLPLTLYTAPNFLDQTNFYESRKIFNFSSSSNCLALPDTSHLSVNGLLSTPLHAYELEWKSSPTVDSMFKSSPTSNHEVMLQVTPHQNLDGLF
ncbi:uncharacterized protein LOC120106020 [Phoenix dactylifera]|uniref:Uncharacterized protein LOC120106020 n=1 Tax=Phoenix dactylifera TaxID=42345 RepID=A0A8B8ZTS6_PHODC|nr:uncharacterized protein LOC120106020 [Phoenix dactylifera]